MNKITEARIIDDTVTQALRIINDALGDEPPGQQAREIIQAVQSLRPDEPTRVVGSDKIDYLEMVQKKSREHWNFVYRGKKKVRPEDTVYTSVITPLGELGCTVGKSIWRSEKRPDRLAWSSVYELDGQILTINEIKRAGLARRPTTRKRKRNEQS